MSYGLLFGVATLGAAGVFAYVIGRRQSASAAAVSAAFLRRAREGFDVMRRLDEAEAVWVVTSGTFHGGLGLTDQRVILAAPSGLELIDRRDIARASVAAKDLGGARRLPGHVVKLELRDGRRHVLDVVDDARYLPVEHDVRGLLARLESIAD